MLGARIRSLDWSQTPLGPIDAWPQSLRSAVSILLPSKAQIALFWGERFITLYNDAYRPVFDVKHPEALGKPISQAWDELWRAGLDGLFAGVIDSGDAFWARDRPFFMERHGYLEETFFDVSDDNLDAAETLEMALELHGFDTRVAADGPRALACAESFAPTVAVLDIGLPVMDGNELARRLKRLLPDIRLVAVTGYGGSAGGEAWTGDCFEARLLKPVEVPALLAAISRQGATRDAG